MKGWLIALLIIAGILPFLVTQSHATGHRSDAALIADFHARRAVFERLLDMIRHDSGLERVDDTWTRPADPASIGISLERVAEYRSLFAQAGTPRGIEAYDPSRASVYLLASALGTTVHGSTKGYVWFASPPAPLVADLDEYAATAPRRSGPGYRAIVDSWYLYFIED